MSSLKILELHPLDPHYQEDYYVNEELTYVINNFGYHDNEDKRKGEGEKKTDRDRDRNRDTETETETETQTQTQAQRARNFIAYLFYLDGEKKVVLVVVFDGRQTRVGRCCW